MTAGHHLGMHPLLLDHAHEKRPEVVGQKQQPGSHIGNFRQRDFFSASPRQDGLPGGRSSPFVRFRIGAFTVEHYDLSSCRRRRWATLLPPNSAWIMKACSTSRSAVALGLVRSTRNRSAISSTVPTRFRKLLQAASLPLGSQPIRTGSNPASGTLKPKSTLAFTPAG